MQPRPSARLFTYTLHCLSTHLPPPPSSTLDADIGRQSLLSSTVTPPSPPSPPPPLLPPPSPLCARGARLGGGVSDSSVTVSVFFSSLSLSSTHLALSRLVPPSNSTTTTTTTTTLSPLLSSTAAHNIVWSPAGVECPPSFLPLSRAPAPPPPSPLVALSPPPLCCVLSRLAPLPPLLGCLPRDCGPGAGWVGRRLDLFRADL